MTAYTRVHNFTTKDSLPTGDSNKKILGKEVDDDFNAARTAINSKLDASIFPNVTGSVTGTQAELNVLDGALSTGLVANKAVIATATPSIELGDQYLEGSNTSRLYPGFITGGNATGYWDTNGGVIFRTEGGVVFATLDGSGNLDITGDLTVDGTINGIDTDAVDLSFTAYPISNNAFIEITGLAQNAIYEIVFKQVTPEAGSGTFDGNFLKAQIGNSAGGSLAYETGDHYLSTGDHGNSVYTNDSTSFDLTLGYEVETAATQVMPCAVVGKLLLFTGLSAGENAKLMWNLMFISQTGSFNAVLRDIHGAGTLLKPNVTDGYAEAIKFFAATGNLVSGSFLIKRIN